MRPCTLDLRSLGIRVRTPVRRADLEPAKTPANGQSVTKYALQSKQALAKLDCRIDTGMRGL